MASYQAIHLVGLSLVKYLASVFPTELRDPFPFEFKLVSSNELNTSAGDFRRLVTLYLYRVTMDPFSRNLAPGHVSDDEAGQALSVDLHYLLSIWADNAQEEQVLLGWVLRQLHAHQALSPSDLIPDAGWDPSDVVQLVPSEISNEDMMRIWDALDPGYRVSVSYAARVVRIAPETRADTKAVVAKRLTIMEPDVRS